MTKNIGKSIRTRLLNLAKEEKQEYLKVLVRYLHERLLFRISASPYKSHFLLKGSLLLFALDGFKTRPTIDIDREFLAEAIVSTFKNRNTPYRENLALFTDEFAADATRNIWWKAFLKKICWKEQIDFSVVMKCIKENLQAYWNKEALG